MSSHMIKSALVDVEDDEFGAILIELGASLRAYARRLTGSAVDGDDLLQDTMLRCWSARASFQPGTSMGAWTRTVMRNSFLSARRRARYQVDMPEEAFDRYLIVPENQTATVDLHDVDLALTELNPGHREAIELAALGMTVEEAATRLSIEPGTFKSRLWRGRERLRMLVDGTLTRAPAKQRVPEIQREIRPEKHRLGRKRRDWTGVMIG